MKIKIKILRQENSEYYSVPIGTVVEEDFETYISAVVASEIGNAPLEACKAQAVASRTFAYRYILKNKAIPDGSSAQAYRAKRYSYAECVMATKATEGQILTYGGMPIDAYFSHSNGGMTVSSQSQWGGARDYLVSKPDPWDAASRTNKTGHGVGMSQVGAKHAASKGVLYKDILAFYYPGTTLTKIDDKEDEQTMVSLAKFLEGCKQNAARIKRYEWGKKGDGGASDCIGYPIGGLELVGQKWGGTHGCNFAVRSRMKDFHKISSASQLKLGQFVFKVRKPGEAKYDLPDKYRQSGASYNGDLNDYYHVGVVTSVKPLEISHCSSGGMHYDKSIGKWSYAGNCSLVDYNSNDTDIPTTIQESPEIGNMVVDVPDDTSVNVRNKPSTSANILTRIPEGTIVKVTSYTGLWSHIEYSYKKTGSGYVMSKFIDNGRVDVPDDTSVNVRRQPSTSAPKITTLPEGTGLEKITPVNGTWSRVEYSFDQTGVGYVMTKYLRKGD